MTHTVAARRDLLEADPGLARRLYEGFHAAKEVAALSTGHPSPSTNTS